MSSLEPSGHGEAGNVDPDLMDYLRQGDPYLRGFAPANPIASDYSSPEEDSSEDPMWLDPDDTPSLDYPPTTSPPEPEEPPQLSYYTLEVLEGTDPLEFYFYRPWESIFPGNDSEWSVSFDISRFLDSFLWFEGEWHIIWEVRHGPVYCIL